MSERPGRYLPPPIPEHWPTPPPVIFGDGLALEDEEWLIAHLLHQSKLEGTASKRAKRAGYLDESRTYWDKSARLFRIATALQQKLNRVQVGL